uniref:Glycoside hydrolase family 5 domain-containing protein n=1 Tax=Hanusia phi TaxID=3032 RepID=A0A7S0EH12_9CRYP|mmetsp:Transcript_24408/g.55021  ORF Transcript_24408/g.55021 Transcript_24408/m.55021 type:complete len:530 (+) Transcript_24408:348-1937(+)
MNSISVMIPNFLPLLLLLFQLTEGINRVVPPSVEEDLISAIHLGEPGATGFRPFVDAAGRERLFHGVNAIVKGAPWHPSTEQFDFQTSLHDLDFDLLKKAGVNVIRLGTMWPGVEPERGRYNMTYIGIIKSIAQNAAKRGIYTLLDMHQDALAERFCGEGVPDWAIVPSGRLRFPEPYLAPFDKFDPVTGFPTVEECLKTDWSRYYFAEAVSSAFQAIYDNKDGLLDAWANMWATVAAAFKDEPYVLGIELVNEPWCGNIFHNPLLLVPEVADEYNLQRVYDRLATAIWEVDPKRLVFFAGVTWDNYGNGFSHPPGGKQNANRSVLVFHHYEWPGGPQLKNSSFQKVAIHVREAERLNTGIMLTEFGEECASDSIFARTAGAAESMFVSWAVWEYKMFCNGNISDPLTQWGGYGACKTGFGGCLWTDSGELFLSHWAALSRGYPLAIAGDIRHHQWTRASGRLELSYSPNPNVSSPSLIYVSEEFFFPNGLDVQIFPKLAARWVRLEENYIEVHNIRHVDLLRVIVQPA